MLKSLRIRNYRVFKDLKVDGLHRINLIAGKNNSGKTSFLEAVFMLGGAGNPELVINANVIRTGQVNAMPSQEFVESVWKVLFHSLDTANCINIEGHHDNHGLMNLSVSAVERWHGTESIPQSGFSSTSLSESLDFHAITLRYKDSHDGESVGQIRTKPVGYEISQPSALSLFPVRIVLPLSGTAQEDAQLLGKLRIQKRGEILLKALRVMEPKLASIEDNYAFGTPMVLGDVGLSELVPLTVMGEGMTRLARMVLGISAVPGGILLVDEIENGIHHSVMSKVWKAVATAAEQFDTQVFATTHSFECIQDAYKGLGKNGFKFFRLGKTREDDNEAVMYKPDMIELAIRRNMEVR